MMLFVTTVAGSIGALCRYLLSGVLQERTRSDFPVGTLAVNLVGAFLLGLVTGTDNLQSTATLTAVGFLGGFTTFSTWMIETIRLGIPLSTSTVRRTQGPQVRSVADAASFPASTSSSSSRPSNSTPTRSVASHRLSGSSRGPPSGCGLRTLSTTPSSLSTTSQATRSTSALSTLRPARFTSRAPSRATRWPSTSSISPPPAPGGLRPPSPSSVASPVPIGPSTSRMRCPTRPGSTR